MKRFSDSSSEIASEDDLGLEGLEAEIDGIETSNEPTEQASADDLDSLKTDLGEIEFTLPEDIENEVKEVEKIESSETAKVKVIKENDGSKESAIIFNVGKEEKDLLEMAKSMQGKIPNSEWNEIAGASTKGTYEVQSGDWLWKISQKVFGLNPLLTASSEEERTSN